MDDKLNESIRMIRYYAGLAEEYGGYTVCFSGGKDSQVLLRLFELAGVKFHAIYNLTTIDPPDNVLFIRKNYPQVKIIRPKLNFFQLIEKKKCLPMMNRRFCCSYLKERIGNGICAMGIRHEESYKRKKYEVISLNSKRKFDELMYKGQKCRFYPMLDWSELDVWTFIDDEKLQINPIYEHAGRVGCMFCPYASTKQLIYYAKQYPGYFNLFLKTLNYLIDIGRFEKYGKVTANDVWEWYISKKSMSDFFYPRFDFKD